LQRADAARGVFAPDYLLDRTLEVMQGLRSQPAGQSQLVRSVARRAAAAGVAGDHAARAERIVADQVYPALDRQLALIGELRRRAVHDAGVWRLPDGAAYYAAALEASTTTKLGAEEFIAWAWSRCASWKQSWTRSCAVPASPAARRASALPSSTSAPISCFRTRRPAGLR
jgi:uncharacterized protein (DUF885 family)